MRAHWQRLVAAPILASGFRPFYLLGALYAPLVAAGGAGALAGLVDLDSSHGRVLWHGHEMLFGFATAIVVGTLLTALPSWAGTPEARGAPLFVLALTWLMGRIAFWAVPWWPSTLVSAMDVAFCPVLAAWMTPALWRVPNRLYRLVVPILAALALANLAYHAAVMTGEPPLAARALRCAVWALVVLYSLKGGVLTPIFTGNAMRELGRGGQARFVMPLEVFALGLLVAAAACDVAGSPAVVSGSLAAGCAATQGVRVMRWQGWRVADQPLLPSMHLGFAWLLAALALKAAADLGNWWPEPAWVHVFTVGALGMMMLSLMTRVSLRHTGRSLHAPRLMKLAAVGICLAGGLRLAAAVSGSGSGGWAIASAALIWAGAFVAYLVRFAAVLLRPSLPRAN